ncbi:hypothetical protein D3C74_349170 [compost metagenome]
MSHTTETARQISDLVSIPTVDLVEAALTWETVPSSYRPNGYVWETAGETKAEAAEYYSTLEEAERRHTATMSLALTGWTRQSVAARLF